MMDSFFIVYKDSGTILLEKHWRNFIPQNVIKTYFNNHVKPLITNNKKGLEIQPIIATNQYQLVNIQVDQFLFIGGVAKDVSPLSLVEFLYRIVDVMSLYIGSITEFNIKDNFIIIYQLLEEMIDYGNPLVTDISELRGLVEPPNLINKVITKVTGVSKTHGNLLSGSVSDVPWRKMGIIYRHNEIYFDLIEEIDAVIDSDGSIVTSEINGSIMANCRLSGMPDLNVTFGSIKMLDDYTFHPCVRHSELNQSRLLRLIPPDGQFKLMTYRSTINKIPIMAHIKTSLINNQGKLELNLRMDSSFKKNMEHVLIKVNFNDDIKSISANPNLGQFIVDINQKQMIWKLDSVKINEKTPMLTGTYTSNSTSPMTGYLEIYYQIQDLALTNLKIDSLKVVNESYKPYKGVRSLTKSGTINVRF